MCSQFEFMRNLFNACNPHLHLQGYSNFGSIGPFFIISLNSVTSFGRDCPRTIISLFILPGRSFVTIRTHFSLGHVSKEFLGAQHNTIQRVM